MADKNNSGDDGQVADLVQQGLDAMGDSGKQKTNENPSDTVADSGTDKDVTDVSNEIDEKKGPSAKGWAAVKIQEKKIREERSRLAEERRVSKLQLDQAKQHVEKLKDEASRYTTDLRASFSRDPFGVLKNQFGVTLDDLANMALDGSAPQSRRDPQDDPEKKLLVEKIDKLQKMFEHSQNERHETAYKHGIRQAIASEQYDILQIMPNAENEVFTLAVEHAKQTGEALPPEKATAILAKYWRAHLGKIGAHKSARKALGLSDEEHVDEGDTESTPRQQRKTITKKLSSPSKPSGTKVPDNLSQDEELRMAAKLIPDDAWDNLP